MEQFGTNTSLIAEISAYFRAPKFVPVTADHDHECLLYLDKFPVIQEIYLKYNCIFQTEADIERVFSYAGRFPIYNFFCAVFLCSGWFVLVWFGLKIEFSPENFAKKSK